MKESHTTVRLLTNKCTLRTFKKGETELLNLVVEMLLAQVKDRAQRNLWKQLSPQ